MAGLLIKNLSSELHEKIKELARENRRSMTQEALMLLEEAIQQRRKRNPPTPHRGTFPITNEWIDMAKREGRE